MLRMRAIFDSKAAIAYFGRSDGYYLVEGSDLRREVGGNAAELLGLDSVEFTQFERALQGLDPLTGKQLTAKLVDNRLAGWDVTASIPKGVTVALESGDSRIHDALWEAGREAMRDLESHITTRVRKGGVQDDRQTGNLLWFGFEHPETRPAKSDNMPDPDRHIHFVVTNLTFDPVEKEWKAIKFRPVMDLRKWFDRRFDSRLASKLTDLGYEVETKLKEGRYYSWDIKGIPQTVVTKFSRRSGEVEKLAEELKVETPTGKDKLGATSRQHKREDMTLNDYRKYWVSRITPKEGKQIEETIKAAKAGKSPKPTNTPDRAAAYAISHHFEKCSVVPTKELEITAMERSMGAALPEQMLPELRKRGLLTKGEEATTREVLEQESRIIAFAREGKGTMRPLIRYAGSDGQGLEAQPVGERPMVKRGIYGGDPPIMRNDLNKAPPADLATLSPEQQAVCRHVWESPDQVILIRGAAGTGKTTAMKAAIAGIDRPVTVLAPSADASRGVLRREGFKDADTVAAFLGSEQAQQKAKVIWVDEAGLLPIRDLARLTEIARKQNARLILQGDPKQHKSVARHGNMFKVLQEFAGLPVAELKDIRRQSGKYKDAVKAIDRGDFLKAHDILSDLGYIHQVPVFDHNKPLVDDYMAGLAAGKSMLVVAPTHKEGDEITAAIRDRLKKEEKLGEERVFDTLKPLGWTEAQRADPLSYTGEEVVQFHRNSGACRAGDRIAATDSRLGDRLSKPEHFSVYAPGQTRIAAGDTIRITSNGWTLTDARGRKHRLDNGSLYTVRGFTEGGDIALSNGWTVGKGFGHLALGYVSTSHASQGKTVDRVLIAMGHESRPAINAEQFYVSVSRGREKATIYTDLNPTTIREAIQKQDSRKSATELLGDLVPLRRTRTHSLVRRLADGYHRLRERIDRAINEVTLTRSYANEGLSR